MPENAGPQRPDETDAQYMRRMGRVSREHERIAAEERKADRLEKGAYEDRERRLSNQSDRDLDAFLKQATGGAGLDKIQDAYKSGKITDPTVMDAVNAVRRAQRGRATKARNRRVKKTIRKNKPLLKKAGKQAKNGCAVIAVMLLGAAGGLGWAIYEGASAIVSAAGH